MGTVRHITFGTYGDRLHGDARRTVDRRHNVFGTPFLGEDRDRVARERSMLACPPVVLGVERRVFVERILPVISVRGGWRLIVAAAGPNHVHTLVETDPRPHGEEVRRRFKRWSTEAMRSRFADRGGAPWWAEGGSTKAVEDAAYLRSVVASIERQRASAPGCDSPAHG